MMISREEYAEWLMSTYEVSAFGHLRLRRNCYQSDGVRLKDEYDTWYFFEEDLVPFIRLVEAKYFDEDLFKMEML